MLLIIMSEYRSELHIFQPAFLWNVVLWLPKYKWQMDFLPETEILNDWLIIINCLRITHNTKEQLHNLFIFRCHMRSERTPLTRMDRFQAPLQGW